jgi:hypothetical protein
MSILFQKLMSKNLPFLAPLSKELAANIIYI